MDMLHDIRPISYVKANASDLVDRINKTRRPLIVTQNGEARAVVIDPASYQNMMNGIKMFKLLAQSEQEILAKKFRPQSDVFADLEKKVK